MTAIQQYYYVVTRNIHKYNNDEYRVRIRISHIKIFIWMVFGCVWVGSFVRWFIFATAYGDIVFHSLFSSSSISSSMRFQYQHTILPSETFLVSMLSLLTIRCVHFISFADIKSNGCAKTFDTVRLLKSLNIRSCVHFNHQP